MENKASRFIFKPENWFTPNTFDTNFKEPSTKCGVYFLVYLNIYAKRKRYKILYVGSAKNLKVRYEKHEVRRLLTEIYGYIQFYWKEEENYREVEKYLIKTIQPKFNKQWR